MAHAGKACSSPGDTGQLSAWYFMPTGQLQVTNPNGLIGAIPVIRRR